MFRLIKSLSRQQRSNFSRFVEARKGKKQKYLVIYDRMLACSAYQEDEIRGQEFKDARKYYQNREILADKLIQSLVQYESSKVSGREYILRAVEYNANELARKKFLMEVENAYQAGDYIQLLSFYNLRNNISEAYGILLDLPDSFPNLGEVRTMEQQSSILAEVLDALRMARNSEVGKWGEKAVFIKSRLRNVSPSHPRDTYRYQKALAGLSILTGDFEGALQYQRKVVEILSRADFPLSGVICIKETSILIRLANRLGEYDLAMRSLATLSEKEPQSPREEDIRRVYRIKSSVTVAGTTMNMELARRNCAELRENKTHFSPSGYAIHLLGSALVYFGHGAYHETLEIVEEIRSLARSQWEEISWVVNVLRCIAHFELRNEDLMESLLLASIRQSRKMEAAYPLLIFRFLRKVWTASPETSKSVLKDAAQHFQTIENEPHVQPLMEVFNLGLWLESKLSGKSYADLRVESLQRRSGDPGKIAL